MSEQNPDSVEILEGIDLQPRHESWARVETHSALWGFLIALALIGSFIVAIMSHFNPIALAAIVVLAIAWIVIAIARNRTTDKSKGVPSNLVLTLRVKADIHEELSTNGIQVESSSGMVTLRGTVPYDNFRDAAEQIARRAGAVRVNNELKVAETGASRTDDYLTKLPGVTTPEGAPEVSAFVSPEESLRAALEADPRINPHLIDVQVDLGMAMLTGRQETIQASQAATAIAAHTPGIVGVANDIEIMPSI